MTANQETSALGLTSTTGGDEHPLPMYILDDDAHLRTVAHRVVDALIDGRDYQVVQAFCEAAMRHMFDDDSGGIRSRAIADEFYSEIVEEEKLSPDARQKLHDFCLWLSNRMGYDVSFVLPRILDYVKRFKPSLIAAMAIRDRDRIPEREAKLLDAMSETEPQRPEAPRNAARHQPQRPLD